LVVDIINQGDRSFTFDLALDSCTKENPITQQDMFELCGRDVVLHVLDGFNVSVIAYGQTGSGKTHTMFGSDNDKGLIV
ncbi:hypothetical protein, partial [Streptococcus pneumoniae]|uniref:hypothetical protein n=1 Tax=Streptococcus pneumoniae TaxID=1313 RepID=UPI0012D7CECA